MSYKIGSARSDERYKYSGGTPGDQRQKKKNGIDGVGEVSIQDFYVHEKGWICIVAKSARDRKAIAEKMIKACNNKNIGYSKTGRYGVIKYGIDTITPCNADCSSLVRQCVREAVGSDPGDFNTASEVAVLRRMGIFDIVDYTPGMKLKTGTILVTRTKGHTVIVTQGDDGSASKKTTSKSASKTYPKYKGVSVSIVDALSEIEETDTSLKNRKKIAAANNIDNYTGTAAQNNKMLQLLKAGKLVRA